MAGPGHVTSELVAIGKRQIKLVIRHSSGTLKKTVSTAPMSRGPLSIKIKGLQTYLPMKIDQLTL